MNNNENKALREAFERWATSTKDESICRPLYGCFGNVMEYRYSDEAWQAYKAAHKAALNSLCVGVATISEGATISLLSKVGGHVTVLACGFTGTDNDNFFRVVV